MTGLTEIHEIHAQKQELRRPHAVYISENSSNHSILQFANTNDVILISQLQYKRRKNSTHIIFILHIRHR